MLYEVLTAPALGDEGRRPADGAEGPHGAVDAAGDHPARAFEEGRRAGIAHGCSALRRVAARLIAGAEPARVSAGGHLGRNNFV